MTNPHPAYRPDIDGLRAVAILAIVVFHAFPELVQGGFVGVDIFFVISGYLISGILLRGMARGDFSFAEFYSRRIKRISPALIVVLSSCLVFAWFALLPAEYKALGKHSAAGAAFLANFVFWHETGYFDTASELKPLLHLWSLSIEEQFYVLWPAVLFVAYRFKLPVLGMILLIAVCSFFMNVAYIKNDLSAAFYLPPSRVWELLMGGVLAEAISRKESTSLRNAGGRIAALLLASVARHTSLGAPCTASRQRCTNWYFLSRKPPYLNFHRQNRASASAAGNFKSALGLALIFLSVFSLNKSHLFPGWWALLPTMEHLS